VNLPESILLRRGLALLLVLVAALLAFRLGTTPLVGPDEPRYARVAVEMHRSGDYVTPTLTGRPWLEKPALYYWLAAGAMHALGENETAARLPSVVACLAWVLTVVFCGTRLYGRSAGLHAGFVLGTSLLAFVYGRAAAMDMLLAATVTGATGLFGLVALERVGRWAVPVAYGLAGLAVLAKGPLGCLLPALVLGAYLAVARDGQAFRRLLSVRGVLIFLLVAAPWHVHVLASQGSRFLEIFVLNHNLRRFFSTIHQHPGPLYYYVPVVLGSLFPWSALVLPALARMEPRRVRTDLLLLAWLVLPLGFFSAAGSKLPGYVLPCLAPLAIVMGRWADEIAHERLPGSRPMLLRLAAVVSLVAGTLAALAPLLLRRRGEPVWTMLVPAAVWALVASCLFAWRLSRDAAGALALMRVGAAGLLLLLAFVSPAVLSRLESGRDLFRLAHGEEVLVYGARRSVWMGGYFYNDGRVREVASLEELLAEAALRPTLVLCGPRQLAGIESGTSRVTRLATGARGATLIRLDLPRPGPPASRVVSPS
jgi:4-amino-4-deoxy-L-arabinose transferase-like glycosyltransferase